MAKKVANILKLQIPAGGANPSPPVGPALGQVGVNICLLYTSPSPRDRTRSRMPSSA